MKINTEAYDLPELCIIFYQIKEKTELPKNKKTNFGLAYIHGCIGVELRHLRGQDLKNDGLVSQNRMKEEMEHLPRTRFPNASMVAVIEMDKVCASWTDPESETVDSIAAR